MNLYIWCFSNKLTFYLYLPWLHAGIYLCPSPDLARLASSRVLYDHVRKQLAIFILGKSTRRDERSLHVSILERINAHISWQSFYQLDKAARFAAYDLLHWTTRHSNTKYRHLATASSFVTLKYRDTPLKLAQQTI